MYVSYQQGLSAGVDFRADGSANQKDSDNVIKVVFVFFPSTIGAMETIRVLWTLNGVVDAGRFPADSIWADVRNYIWDVRVKSGRPVPPENIHVRPRFRAHV